MQLESDAFPIWQNAIRSTRQFAGKPINQTLREWMNEPVDLTEASFSDRIGKIIRTPTKQPPITSNT